MFEEPLYQDNPIDQPADDHKIFSNYEIRSWQPSPRLYKILGMSVLANILALFVFAQTSLLTMKGCDSPLVGGVCQVLDTLYIGSLLFGTDREYVDQVYERTDLGDAEITFVDVTGETPPLSYPEGYFQLANPEQFTEVVALADGLQPGYIAPGIPSYSPKINQGFNPPRRPNLTDTRPNPPKPKADVVDDNDLPKSIDDATVADATPGNNKRRPGNKNGANVPDRNPDGSIPGIPNSVANNDPKVTKTDPKTPAVGPNGDPVINRRPFVDLATNVNELLDANQFKLESAFIVNASGKLTKEGRLDPKSFRYLQAASNDEKMIDVVKESIEAINDSGYLLYLKDLSGKDFNLLIQQDEINLTAIIQSQMESEARAKSIKSSLDFLIGLAKSKKDPKNADQNDKDDLMLLENAKIEIDGKKVIIRFVVPKDVAIPMIQRKLAEQKAKPPQPNGNAQIRTANSLGLK